MIHFKQWKIFTTQPLNRLKCTDLLQESLMNPDPICQAFPSWDCLDNVPNYVVLVILDIGACFKMKRRMKIFVKRLLPFMGDTGCSIPLNPCLNHKFKKKSKQINKQTADDDWYVGIVLKKWKSHISNCTRPEPDMFLPTGQIVLFWQSFLAKNCSKTPKKQKWPILVLPEVDFTKIAKSS